MPEVAARSDSRAAAFGQHQGRLNLCYAASHGAASVTIGGCATPQRDEADVNEGLAPPSSAATAVQRTRQYLPNTIEPTARTEPEMFNEFVSPALLAPAATVPNGQIGHSNRSSMASAARSVWMRTVR